MVVRFSNTDEPQHLEAYPTVPTDDRTDRFRVVPPETADAARWKALHDGKVADHDKIWGAGNQPIEPGEPGERHTNDRGNPLKMRNSYISRLTEELAPRTLRNAPEGTKEADYGGGDAMKLAHFKMQQALYLLSSFELSEMLRQVGMGPRTEKEVYKTRYREYAQKRLREHEQAYPHSAVKGFVPGEDGHKKEWHYLERTENALHPMRFSRVAPLKVDGEQVFPEYVEAYHHDFGRILLGRRQNTAGDWLPWQAFDGLAHDGNKITYDNTRSSLLLENGLLTPVQEALTHLNSVLSPSDIEGMRGNDHIVEGGTGYSGGGMVELSGSERFNADRGIVPHIPTVQTTKAQEDLIGSKLAEISERAKLDADSPNINSVKELAGDHIVLYSMINNLARLDPNTLVEDYETHKAQNFMGIGHPDQHGVNKADLHNALNNRNARYEETAEGKKFAVDRGEAHPITGYSPPLKPTGLPVTRDEMTADEKELLRNHYGDLYDRPAAYLQHTKNGQAIYKAYRNKSAKLLSDMLAGGSKKAHIENHANFKPISKKGAHELINNDGEFNVDENSILSGLPVSEIFNEYDSYKDFLSNEQANFLNQVDKSDIAKHILGIDVDGDQLVHDMTMDTLLGVKWHPTTDEWDYYDRTGNMEVNHINDAFSLRIGGLLQLGPKYEDGNYSLRLRHTNPEELGIEGLTYPMEGEGEAELTDFPIDIADSNSTQYAGNLYNLFRPSVLDQFVRDGILPKEYASSGAVKRRPGAPEPPKHGDPECLERVAFIHAMVSDYPPNEKIHMLYRGFDNSPASFEYDIDPANPDAIKIANAYSEHIDPDIKSARSNIYNLLVNQMNKRYGNGQDIFYYGGDVNQIQADVDALDVAPPIALDGRLMTVVTMPDGSRQAFYRRTGAGNADKESDTEPGIWMPFGGIMPNAWVIKPDPAKADKGFGEDSKLYRYGNAEQYAMSQKLGNAFEANMLFPDQENLIELTPNDRGGQDAEVKNVASIQSRLGDMKENGYITPVSDRPELYKRVNQYLAGHGFAEAGGVLKQHFDTDYEVGTPMADHGGPVKPPTPDDPTDAEAAADDDDGYRYGNLSFTQVMDDLAADPSVRAYRKQLQDKHDSEILQNAPINIRATAWRQRLAGIEEQMKLLETQGDAHRLTRELMRAAIVEHPDMIRIDRDGASKFRRLSRQLVEGGADLYAIDKELQDHKNTVNDMEHTMQSIKEYQEALKASGLMPDPRETPPDEWTKEEKEAYERYSKLQDGYLDFHERKIRYTYGSDEHIEKLYDPKYGLAEVYNKMDNTSLSADAQQQLSNYSRLKDGKNVVADALRVGGEAYRESRLLGNSRVASMLQAVMATIGEGTGFGGDKIRNLDVTKPLDQHWSEAGGWGSWLKLPIPERIGNFDVGARKWFGVAKIPDALKHETSEAWRRKQAGQEGEVYTPDPKAEDPEYAGPLERTQGKITVAPPKYKQDSESPQEVNPPEGPIPEPEKEAVVTSPLNREMDGTWNPDERIAADKLKAQTRDSEASLPDYAR